MYNAVEEENLSKNIIKLLFMQSIDISFPSDFLRLISESGMTFCYAENNSIYKSFHDDGMWD